MAERWVGALSVCIARRFCCAVRFLLVNAPMDTAQRVPTLQRFGVIVLGVPVCFPTVGRRRRA